MKEAVERWLPYPGYAGFYEVSDQGGVMSLARATTRGGLLKLQLNSKGYRVVGLSKYGRVKIHRVGRMVLETFRGPCPYGQEACHGPGGKLDDNLPNLYWGTPARNQADRVRDDTSNQGERSARAALTEVIVKECRRRYAAGETQTALCREFGVSSGAMNRAIRGGTWAHVTGAIEFPEDGSDGRARQLTEQEREQRRVNGRKGAAVRWG